MGLISELLDFLFGGSRNVVRETVGVFRENAENGAKRSSEIRKQAMRQFNSEFTQPESSSFDRFMNGLNRVPRPALAFGTLGLFITAMIDPLWFAARMQGLALVPEPMWWLLGVIVSFYFGARHQMKEQQFQRDMFNSMSRVTDVIGNIETLSRMRGDSPGVAGNAQNLMLSHETVPSDHNPALMDWRKLQR